MKRSLKITQCIPESYLFLRNCFSPRLKLVKHSKILHHSLLINLSVISNKNYYFSNFFTQQCQPAPNDSRNQVYIKQKISLTASDWTVRKYQKKFQSLDINRALCIMTGPQKCQKFVARPFKTFSNISKKNFSF